MKAVIPMAGRGSRMYPLGITRPKGLLEIANKPILEWNIEALAKNDVDEVIIVIGTDEFGEMIKDYFKENPPKNVKIEFAYQHKKLGTAHVLQMAKDYFKKNEKFYYVMGDNLVSPKDLKKLKQYDNAVLSIEVEEPSHWGIFDIDNESNLKKVVEKPKSDIGNLANTASYYIDSIVFELYQKIEKSPRGEYEFTDLLNLLAQKQSVKVIPIQDYWKSVGFPWDFLDATKILMDKMDEKKLGEIENGVTIKGKVILPKSSIIKSGTYIEGDLVVGENSILGPNVHIRETVVVGNNSKVDFGSVIKNSVIGHNTQITQSYIGDSVIGDNVNFPRSVTISYKGSTGIVEPDQAKSVETVVKNSIVNTNLEKFGTVIGEDVKLGVNNIIYPGVKIWPGYITEPNQTIKRDLINQWT